jgi:hypothetical protein
MASVRYTEEDLRRGIDNVGASVSEKADSSFLSKSVNMKAGKDELHLLQDKVGDVASQLGSLAVQLENHVRTTKKSFSDLAADVDYTSKFA